MKQSSDRQLNAAEAAAEVMAAVAPREGGRRVQWWAVRCGARWTAARYCCARLAAGPQTRVWWEAVVLLRKAVLVILAMVVIDPFLQVMLAVLLFATTTVLQQHMLPYTINAFNNLETGMLAVLYITAAVSTLQLPTTVGATVSPLSATITDRLSIVVLVLNLAMTAALGSAVAWYASSTVVTAIRRRAAAKLIVVARRLSVVARPSVVNLPVPVPAQAADPPETADPTLCTVVSELAQQKPEAVDSSALVGDGADPQRTVPGAALPTLDVFNAPGSAAPPPRRRRVLEAAVPVAPTTSTSAASAGDEPSTAEADAGAGALDAASASHRVLFGGVPSVPAPVPERLAPPSTDAGSRDAHAPPTAPPPSNAPSAGGAAPVALVRPPPPRPPPSRVADTRHSIAAVSLAPQPSRRPPRRAGAGASTSADVVSGE